MEDLRLPDGLYEPHCSVIHNSTLYAVSGKEFWALPLMKNGNWTKLPGPIVQTRGQVCVRAHRDMPGEELYLVGGNVEMQPGSIPKDYAGLQRWSFTANQWEILPLQNQLIYNMTGHGSTYVEESNQLLVYGGSKWPQAGQASQQTYLINTLEPFATTSIPAGLCPPLADPMVFPWDNGGMICGGGATNNHLFTYSPQSGWKQLSATLDHGLSKSNMGVALIQKGQGGPRALMSFDFSGKNVEVKQTPLSGAKRRLARRQSETPVKFNNTFAPEGGLENFSVASNDKWITFLGGKAGSAQALNIFNYQENTWVNSAALLNVKNADTNQRVLTQSEEPEPSSISPQEASSTPSASSVASTSSATQSPTAKSQISASSSAAPSTASSQNNTTTMKLLFIILGVVILVALILGVAYVILRCRRKRQATEKGTSRKMGHSSTQSVLSIADRGVSFMKEAGGPAGKRRNNSIPRAGVDYPDFDNLPRGSTVGLAAGTSLEMHSRQRGSGWSKYFSGNSQTNLVEHQPSRNRSTTCSDARSSYSMSSMPDEFDSPRISAPSLGHVRSSNATSSAVFSQILPTPVMANVMGTSPPKNGAGLVGIGSSSKQDEKRATTLTMSSNFDTKSFASSFNDQPFWNSEMDLNLGQPKIGDHDSRVPSSIFAVYMNDENRDSAVTVFPGPFGFDNTPRHSDMAGGSADQGKAPEPDQGLSWFKRTG